MIPELSERKKMEVSPLKNCFQNIVSWCARWLGGVDTPNQSQSPSRGCMLAPRRLRQADQGFEASLGFIMN